MDINRISQVTFISEIVQNLLNEIYEIRYICAFKREG